MVEACLAEPGLAPRSSRPQLIGEDERPCRGGAEGYRPTGWRRGKVGEITLDAEFQGLSLEPAADEHKQMLERLALEGCMEPLLVWPCQGRLILLVGYEIFGFMRHNDVELPIVEQELASREAARMFIIRHQLARKNIPPLAASYLRGLRYLGDKRPQGGARHVNGRVVNPAGVHQGFGGKTAEALGEIFGLNAATIRRDGAFAAAVTKVMANCGPQARPLLIGRDARLSRRAIIDLAAVGPGVQKDLVFQLELNGRLPRSWRSNGRAATISLPREPQAMAERLLKRLGAKDSQTLVLVLIDLLAEEEKRREEKRFRE